MSHGAGDPTHGRPARRSFLRLVGSVLAGGVGVVALGGTASGETPRPRPRPARGSTQCTDYCYVQACDGCGAGRHRYRCYTPDGRWYGLCRPGDCGDFCV